MKFKKSQIVFYKNMDSGIAYQMATLLRLTKVKNLSNYLIFPMILSNTYSKYLNFILYSVRTKLVGWRADLLFMVDRCILVNSVTNSVLSYFMHCTSLPMSTSKDLEKININFLWESPDVNRKLHNLKWDVLTMPKDKGCWVSLF